MSSSSEEGGALAKRPRMNDLVSEIAHQIVPYVPPVHLNAALYIRDVFAEGDACYTLHTSFSRSVAQPKGELTVIDHHSCDDPKRTWPCWTRSGLKLYLDNLEDLTSENFCLVFWTGDSKNIPYSTDMSDEDNSWEDYFPNVFTVQHFKAIDPSDHPAGDADVKSENAADESDDRLTRKEKLANLEAWEAKKNKYMRRYDATLTCATAWILSFIGGVECDASALSIHCD